MAINLKIFTLNCWGIPIISKNRKERIEAIAKYLLRASHNIVCLQEVWSEDDYLYIKDQLQNCLPYSHYFYSGVLGSGLCVFSKWLIQDVFFHQWPLNGYIHKIHHGDWFGGKGVGLCRIICNDRLINVYCTHLTDGEPSLSPSWIRLGRYVCIDHTGRCSSLGGSNSVCVTPLQDYHSWIFECVLHAEYHEDDIYLAHRVLQAYSTAEFVNITTSPADVSILAGDLNAAPGDLSFRLITQLPVLIDPCSLDYIRNAILDKVSGTSDNVNNSYSDPKLVKVCPQGKRIDHILFHVNTPLEAEVVDFGNPLEDRVPGEQFSYSDHNAVALELKITPTNNKLKQRQFSAEERFQDTILEAMNVCREATVTISKSKKLFLTTGGLMFMFLLGSVGFWPNNMMSDVIKIIITGICFYYISMGTLWNRIEMNSLKAGLTALENFNKSRNYNKMMIESNDND